MDVGNRSPFGPAYHVAWNRNAPGHVYHDYRPRRVGTARALFEDLLQPWYYPYIFRKPRYGDDTGDHRADLADVGLAPKAGARERGVGISLLGVSISDPLSGLAQDYGRSTGVSLVRNASAKVRLGSVELYGGYQRFPRTSGEGGSLWVYPVTASLVARMPEALVRPYFTVGGGIYGWESRMRTADERLLVWSGWNLGSTGSVGFEYSLRTYIALDVSLRFHATRGPASPDLAAHTTVPVRFRTLSIGHYVRF
jgi:hypothetical protein